MRIGLHRTSLALVSVVFACSCAAPGDRGAATAAQDSPTALQAVGSAARPLLRFPDVHGEMIVFVSGEDIWRASTSGGMATRLTIHDGAERFPKFSKDGTLIAFTGDYDGNTDVYVMNVDGGDIRRVTYHPGGDEVIGWHPTKNKILFRSTRDSYSRFERLYLAGPDGSGLEPLILHEAAQGSFSPDGGKIAYNRVARENRTWKRYRGGKAQEVYVYDFATDQDRNLTQYDGTDRIPMWIGDKIYFSSDRDRVLNLYSVDPESGRIEQITRHGEYDVRRPSMGGSKIVYEQAGAIWLLDVATHETHEVPIRIGADAAEARAYLKDVSDAVTAFDCSPTGARALVVARGEVFSVPKKEGPTRNLSRDCGARDKDAAWSPDGKRVAYLSDRNGEYEIYLVDPKGEGEAIRLTHHKDGYRHTLRWSPDSRKIAFADQTLRCYFLDVETKEITEVDKAEFENVDVSLDVKPIYDFNWSPDSRFLAYSKMNADLVFQVFIYSLEEGRARQVSDGLFSDFGPVFSADGEHLFFLSNRRFNPTFCDFEWEMVYKDVAGVYVLTLRKDGPALLPLESDEEPTASDDDEREDGDEKGESENGGEGDEEDRVAIDFDGLSSRIEALPLSPGNYRRLGVNKSSLFYLNAEKGDFNRFEYRGTGPMTLHSFSFDKRKEATVIERIDGYKLSADGKKVVYKKGKSVGIIDASAKDSKGKKVDLSGLKMWLDPKLEWQQIFNEAWRMERDFYYEPDMHGLDWEAMRKKYGRLIPLATCRQDIRFIVGELIGELNTSHTYVFGGDRRRTADRVNVGMLGVDWEIDEAADRYRFKRIFRVVGWTRGMFPPLARSGVDVREGDYLLRVNGQEVTAGRSVYAYFQGLGGKRVSLLVNDKPTAEGAREFLVEPARGERTLRYLDWVEHNRQVVAKASDGQIGYIHLPDTYTRSAREFPKYFYGQTRKKGLVVDGRYNGGGLDPDIFLQRLDKKLLTYWTRRYSHDQTTPAVVTRAHLACLTNRQAGSGGDMLPMEFKIRGMGPVIGTRSWGGLVGVSMFVRLIDGGGLTAPDYRIYDRSGKWIVENVGVAPDIEVDLQAAEMARGYDAQLMKAVEVLMKKIDDEPRPWPGHAPFPVDR